MKIGTKYVSSRTDNPLDAELVDFVERFDPAAVVLPKALWDSAGGPATPTALTATLFSRAAAFRSR